MALVFFFVKGIWLSYKVSSFHIKELADLLFALILLNGLNHTGQQAIIVY